MSRSRPPFQVMWSHFSAIYGDGNIASVGKKIGGKVQQNIETGLSHTDAGFKNACAIRMSYSLNYSGVQVGTGEWATVSGADKKLYIYRVKDLLKYLQTNFGEADKTVNSPKPIDFEGMKGILVFNVSGWSNASGHATLWDGRTCSDHCHFPISREASIWLLK